MRAVHGWMCKVGFDYDLGEAADGTRIYPSLEDLRERLQCVNEKEHRPVEVVTMSREDFDELVAKAGIDPATIRGSNIGEVIWTKEQEPLKNAAGVARGSDGHL
jgi:hypothetical protein